MIDVEIIFLDESSITHEANDTFVEGDLYCVSCKDHIKHKYPINLIKKITETGGFNW